MSKMGKRAFAAFMLLALASAIFFLGSIINVKEPVTSLVLTSLIALAMALGYIFGRKN